MSVINQMLKDLDARQRRTMNGPSLGIDSPAQRLRDGHGRIVLLGMLVLALALSLVGWWLWRAAPAAPAGSAPAAAVPAPEPVPAQAPEPTPALEPTPAPEPMPALAPQPAPAVAMPMPSTAPAPALAPAPVPEPALESATPPRIERLPVPLDPLEAVREALATGDAATALARLEADPSASTAEAIALRANALQQLGRHREAAAAYAAALERQPEVAAWWVGLGMMLEADGRPREAQAAYQEASRRGPLDAALADYARARAEALAAPTPR